MEREGTLFEIKRSKHARYCCAYISKLLIMTKWRYIIDLLEVPRTNITLQFAINYQRDTKHLIVVYRSLKSVCLLSRVQRSVHLVGVSKFSSLITLNACLYPLIKFSFQGKETLFIEK